MAKTLTLTENEIQVLTIALDERIPQIQKAEEVGAYPEEFAKSLLKEIRTLRRRLNY